MWTKLSKCTKVVDRIKDYKIYTAGKMGGLSYSEQIRWRKELERRIKSETDKRVTFVHPPDFYQYGDMVDEKEVYEWDVSQLKDSDIVVVNLSDIADSIGTHIEIGIIAAMNQFGYKHIHMIGVGKPNTDHPWIKMGMLRCVDTIEDASCYIMDYLLI